MPDGVDGEMLPIDFDKASRYASRRDWVRNGRTLQPVVDYPLSNNPDPLQRVLAQGVDLSLPAKEGAKTVETEIDSKYKKFDEAKKTLESREISQRGIRIAELQKRDFEVQDALLSSDHPIYTVMQRVASRIAEAEKKLLATDGMTREETSNEFNFYITRRDSVNAFTFKRGRVVFTEAGLISLFDHYLRESRGYGLAEDHLAALLGHEVSHSDEAAKLQYLNEEYCDVQGMTLTAKAGYNPTAVLDLEEFLVWMDEGRQQYKNIKDDEKYKEHSIMPSHPNPKNRRVVIINALRNKDTVLPNQAKPYTAIEQNVITGITDEMHHWQDDAQKRAIPRTREEVLKNIEGSSSITELLDSYLGYTTYAKAELVKRLNADSSLIDRMAILQGIAVELRARYGGGDYETASGKGLKDDVAKVFYYQLSREKYDHIDCLYGGLAKSIPDYEDAYLNQKASEITQDIEKELDGIIGKIHVDANYAELDKSGKKRTVEQYNAEKEKIQREAQQKSDELTEQLKALAQIVKSLNGKIDVARLLSGDYSEHPELQAQLYRMGIDDFHHYLDGFLENFRALDMNPRVGPIVTERYKQLFTPTEVLSKPRVKMTVRDIRQLLKETKFQRIARFAERGTKFKVYNAAWEDNIKTVFCQKIRNIAQTLTDVPQEQELYDRLITSHFFFGMSEGLDEDETVYQLLTSSIVRTQDETKIVEQFQSDGPTEAVRNLRIAPSYGGDFLESMFAVSSADSSSDERTWYPNIRAKARNLGKKTDRVKVYFHEGKGRFVQSNEKDRFHFALNPRNIEGEAALISKRKSTLPTYGFETIPEHKEADMEIIEGIPVPDSVRFARLKYLAKKSGYEEGYLSRLIQFDNIGTAEKVDYFIGLLEKGEIPLIQLLDAFNFDLVGSLPFYRERTEQRKLYDIGMALMRRLPVAPLPQEVDASGFSMKLYNAKKRIRQDDIAFEKKKAELEANAARFQTGIKISDENVNRVLEYKNVYQYDPYEGLSPEDKAKKQLAFIFEFAREGGVIALTELDYYDLPKHLDVKGMENQGVDVNIIGVLRQLNFPLEELHEQIAQVIEANADRFNPAEIDKWRSLEAFCAQPYLVDVNDVQNDYEKVQVRKNGSFIKLDAANLDHVQSIIPDISSLPECSYKDFCLRKLTKLTQDAAGFFLPKNITYGEGKVFYDHPGRGDMEAQVGNLLVHQISRYGLSLERHYQEKGIKEDIMERVTIPASEKYGNDPAIAFYVKKSEAAQAWQDLVSAEEDYLFHSPFSLNYRKNSKFQGQDRDTVERKVFYDRVRMIQDMPNCELKEALFLYSFRTAYENLETLQNSETFRAELSEVAKAYAPSLTTPFGGQRFFETKLGLELGGPQVAVNPEAIRARFPTSHDFLAYVTTLLPEKTAFRDTYIALASEIYPFEIGDVSMYRNLLFATDYSTSNKGIVEQRGALEFARALQQNDRVTKKDISELVLWLIDEQRQIHSIDEFITSATRTPTGQLVFDRVVKGLNLETEQDPLKYKIPIKTILPIYTRLPLPIKKIIIQNFISFFKQDPHEFHALLTRAGMPSAFSEVFRYTNDKTTFNSIIDTTGGDSPTRREIFFDLMLGAKGILSDPVVLDSASFKDRMAQKFEGNEMHGFLDSVLEITMRKGGWNQQTRKVAGVIVHSLFEGMEPARRATVMYHLFTELPKLDFSEPDQNKLQSRLLNVALSSLGVLGAKMGQTDELFPKRYRSGIASLKHSTKPMPKMMVADIFDQEGLSDRYKIIDNAGAASTACGYVVEDPQGNDEFFKVIRPEVKLDWKEDFRAVNHMLECLKENGYLQTETGPIMQHLQRMVEEELQTQREINNVMQYVGAETTQGREARGGIRAVQMPLPRIGKADQVIEAPADSLLIPEELLARSDYIELSRLKNPNPDRPDYQDVMTLLHSVNMDSIHTIIVDDFLYRALELGSWHSDLHDGNILLTKDGIIRRVVSGNDMVLIDFGQTGSVDCQAKRENAARFLTGLALYDRSEVAQAMYEAMVDKTAVTIESIRNELPTNPLKLQEDITKVMAKYHTDEYLTNFLKATVNVLPYLRSLPKAKQFELISPYISGETRGKLRTRLLKLAAQALPG